jgi:hypothetical protein
LEEIEMDKFNEGDGFLKQNNYLAAVNKYNEVISQFANINNHPKLTQDDYNVIISALNHRAIAYCELYDKTADIKVKKIYENEAWNSLNIAHELEKSL